MASRVKLRYDLAYERNRVDDNEQTRGRKCCIVLLNAMNKGSFSSQLYVFRALIPSCRGATDALSINWNTMY
jgi:hypothetical protein